jgi:asparagine synthase (glutamine-hydrolysing)
MFAFVLYDSQQEKIYAVRDRAGVKPFFYYWRDGLFLFASELKAFHQHPSFRKELDTNAVTAFLQFGHVPTPHCIFKNCHKLRPGYYLEFSLAESRFVTQPYWNVYDAYNKPKLNISFEEAKKETEKILQKAFQYRMVSDVPVGVFLSSGYDSAGVCALLQSNSTQKIKTFTIEVSHTGLNEAPYASRIAQHLGTEHHQLQCTPKDALDLIEDLPYYYDEPFADSSAIPTSLVCKMARKHVTVALSADGGDEVFAGYNRYDYIMRFGKKLSGIPPVIRKLVSGGMKKISSDKIPVLKKSGHFHQRYQKIKNLLADPTPRNIMLNLSRQWSDEEIQTAVTHSFTPPSTLYLSDELKQEFFTPLSYMMAVDYQTYLADDILQKVDRASMRFSLEAREPFLDQHIIEWAARLPDSYKYQKGTKKYILKEIVHRHIPRTLMERPKMGFSIPLEDWLMNDLKNEVLDSLSDSSLAIHNLLNREEIDHLKKDFFSGRKELALKIWHVFMFQLWYKRWMQ